MGNLQLMAGWGFLVTAACLDWSERRYHIAGHLGAEICRCCFERGWLMRQPGSRAIHITPAGRRGLREVSSVTATCAQCLLWVKSRHFAAQEQCPLYPQ